MDKSTWDRFAPFYTLSRRADKKAYEEMYSLMRPKVKGRLVLELATGTGLISKSISASARKIIATDYSEKMIAHARRGRTPKNVSFRVMDATDIKYPDNTFEVVIISNALHIMPQPEKALSEAKRVLRPGGILIAPTYTHGKMTSSRKLLSKLLQAFGLRVESKWSPEEYMDFLIKNGWEICFEKTAEASFPLTYLECKAKPE